MTGYCVEIYHQAKTLPVDLYDRLVSPNCLRRNSKILLELYVVVSLIAVWRMICIQHAYWTSVKSASMQSGV